jgi:hypothetical protein
MKPVKRPYTCQRRGPLQFALGFEGEGARLRLTVVGPDGERFEKTGNESFTIDVEDAATGTWQYTITPLIIPHENFAFTLTIGEKP